MPRRLICSLLVMVVSANLGGVLPLHAHSLAPSASTSSSPTPAPMHMKGLQKISSTSHHEHCPSHPTKPRNDGRCCCCAVCSGGDLPLPVADATPTPPAHVERSQLGVTALHIASFSGRIERPPKANA